MDKIKRFWRNISIRTAFILLTIVFILLATFATSKTNQWALNHLFTISSSYNYSLEQTSENDNDSVIYNVSPSLDTLSEKDRETYKIYQAVYQYSALVWYPICIIAAALIFYRFKFKKPFAILTNAANKITDNDLEFQIDYEGKDEMAQLCTSFETMRSSVKRNNIEMWHSAEERKRVNSAFAHDLRTPVTVIKGYSDMLNKYMPAQKLSREKEIQTITKISSNIERLEQYINSMSAIQKLEDLEITPKNIDINELICELEETTSILCKEKGRQYFIDNQSNVDYISADNNVLMQISENLISNAVRFCKSKVSIIFKAETEYVYISVCDDGQGFSNEEIEMVKKPFYKGEDTSADMHFGLGLYICNLLCVKHSGFCNVSNSKNGGAVVTATLKNFS